MKLLILIILSFFYSFPYDYRSSEFGYVTQLNVTCFFIDTLARLGLAWDLRKASEKIVESSKHKVEMNAKLREKLEEAEASSPSMKEIEANSPLSLKEHQN